VVPAADLYAGDHWSVVRTLPSIARAAGFGADLAIVSAGYGLVTERTLLHGYSATFARGNEDSVASVVRSEPWPRAGQLWWERLAAWNGPEPGSPRSVTQLAQREPQSYILLIGSPDYIFAIEADLVAAARALEDPQRLIVISSRGKLEHTSVAPNLVTVGAAAQPRVGGARVSLHARVARTALEVATHGWLSVESIRAVYEQLSRESNPPVAHTRSRLRDDEVRHFITSAIQVAPHGSTTALLRLLRDTGQACEQRRFRALVEEVRGR
jgi:hypothetical protein